MVCGMLLSSMAGLLGSLLALYGLLVPDILLSFASLVDVSIASSLYPSVTRCLSTSKVRAVTMMIPGVWLPMEYRT